jgi:hypothetical protein
VTERVRFVYSRHARQQMVERRISWSQVERTVTSPTRRLASTNPPGRIIAERENESGNTLRVVYVEEITGTDIVARIITVIRIRRRRR